MNTKIYTQLFLFIQFFTINAFDCASLDTLFNNAIQEKIFPGATVLIQHHNVCLYHKAFGHYTYDEDSPFVSLDTLFDIASLTKVVATTTLAMILYDAQQLSLDDPVSDYLSYFSGNGKEHICIKHLLTHTSGIREEQISFSPISKEELWHDMLQYPLQSFPGSEYCYTCTNMVILQKIIEKITGLTFDECVKKYITLPLCMADTTFCPHDKQRCAPTRARTTRARCIQGEVHDDRAFLLGGVAGNAGLFSTTGDLAKFMTMILNNGQSKQGIQLIKPETVNAWTRQQCSFGRGYGWDIGKHLSSQAFGHFGYTGTSIWADKELNLFCILLTNRTYPDDDTFKIREFRTLFHDLVTKIIADCEQKMVH